MVQSLSGNREVAAEFAAQAALPGSAGARRRAPLSTSFESFAIDWDGMNNL
eukprot:SAG22_NODE_10078_length_554_cov_0.909890_1_plen_50_part_10